MDRTGAEEPRTRPSAITWRETRERLTRDRARLFACLQSEQGETPSTLSALYPAYTCVWFHRVAHYFHRRRAHWRARIAWQLGVWLTGADINPASDIDGGLVILHPAAISISGRAGSNLTMSTLSGVGGLLSRKEDIGAGPGLPVIGDDVYLGPHSGVMGPVRVGHRAHLVGCIVKQDVPDDARAEPPAPKFGSQGGA